MTTTDDQLASDLAAPVPADVGTNYDEFADFYKLINGNLSFHIGMWSRPGELNPKSNVYDLSNSAQQRVVEHCIASLELTAKDHLLDIGCGAGAPAVQAAEQKGARVTGSPTPCSRSPRASGCAAPCATRAPCSIRWLAVPAQGRGALKDTAMVPARGGELTFDWRADNPGEWMLHCHNMENGMMRTVGYR